MPAPVRDERYIAQLGKMQRPIPGQSLTNPPDNPAAFERPPEFTKKNDAIEEIFVRLTEEETYPQLMKAVANKTPVIEITQVLLMEGFRQGKWNPDLFLMLVEPTTYMVMALAERAGIEYEIDRDVAANDEEADSELERKFDSIADDIKEDPTSSGALPDSIEKRIAELPDQSLVERPVEEAPIEPEEEVGLVTRPQVQ